MNPQLLIRTAILADRVAIWGILEPVIRAGETYALPADMGEADAIAYWTGPGREVFVAEQDGQVVGTYFLSANQKGGGDHVANAAYATLPAMRGRGTARASWRSQAPHGWPSIRSPRRPGRASPPCNSTSWSARTKDAVHLWQSLGFEVVGRLPGALRHPQLGPVDALVMFRRL